MSAACCPFGCLLTGVYAMHYPRRRRRWSLWPSRCTCGLHWPCLDAKLKTVEQRYAAADRHGAWAAPTAAYPQIGRAGLLTPGQAKRADGGRH